MEESDSRKLFKVALSNGDREAFEMLFRKFYASMHLFLSKLCGEDEAEDLIQNIFMWLWVNREKIANINSLDDYLFILSRNAAYKSMRNSKHSADLKEANLGQEEPQTDDIQNDLAYQEMHSQIEEEIEKMPKQRREIFKMSRLDGMTNEEIAQAKGLSRRTVEKHIQLALSDLRKVLPAILILAFIHQIS